MPRAELRSLIDLIDEAFDKRAWHGPTLRRAIAGVTPAQAVSPLSPLSPLSLQGQ